MRKAPVDLKAGDLIVGQARCLLKVVSVEVAEGIDVIGSRMIRTTFVSPFTVCEEIPLDGATMIDVWDDTGTEES